MSPLQKIMFGLLFPLLFCGVGFFFAKKGFSYYKTKIDKNVNVYHIQLAKL